ncbi:MAG: aminomethyl transferase family protein [Chloroflexi bacterium]|nr:aminomethyl transferase family protein [Chloroflexota bacterium]
MITPAYRFCLETLAWFPHPGSPLVLASGPDCIAFFQRQTTNDLRLLGPRLIVVAALTDASARILDLLEFIALGPEAIGIRSNCSSSEELARYLAARIFLMDKLTIELSSEDYCAIDIEGPKAIETLERVGFGLSVEANIGNVLNPTDKSSRLHAYIRPGIGGRFGVRVLGPANETRALGGTLSEVAPQLGELDWQILRIEACQSAPHAELSAAYTPLEVGLNWVINNDKGCYTGQEVIARQQTYGKVSKSLTCLQCEVPLYPGQTLHSAQGIAGTVTTAGESPEFGHIGLAVLRKPYHLPGTRLLIGDESGQSAVVTRLRSSTS